LQFRYGQTEEGAEFSWGDAVNANDHVTDFFQTGNTFINSISVSGGNENSNSFFSYANTNANGILPTNELKRHNFSFKQNNNFLNDKLNLNGSLSYINQNVKNRPAGGLYFNPLTGLYFFPRGLDFSEYETNFELFNEGRNFNTQNWIADRDIQQNPHWILNRNENFNVRNRFITSLGAKYKLTESLSVMGRASLDKVLDKFTSEVYASTQATLADNNGRYIYNNFDNAQIYRLVMI